MEGLLSYLTHPSARCSGQRPKSVVISALLLCSPLPIFSTSSLSGIPQATVRIRAAATASGVPFPLVAPKIMIFKEAHRLELWASGHKLKSYTVGLGHHGLADKKIQGDRLTPEGRFYICTRHAQSPYHLFLGLSYPSEVSAERGYREGLISKRQRDAIVTANKRKTCPPWNGPLGGTVGIHGGGSSADWTWGCVALENSEIDELWASCPMGTPIIIAP